MPAYFTADTCHLPDFAALCAQTTDPTSVPHAAEVSKNVPLYDAQNLTFDDALLAEWAQVLLTGPGVLVLRQAYADTAPIDAATKVFDQIIMDEKAAGADAADHFSAGTNDRIWNALQKLCLTDPTTFAAYHNTSAIDAVCRAWLGPGYQMTAQVNVVHPGGAAQQAHRDYHLGFQTAETCAQYPAHVHDLTPALTLQGAVAHCDMPIDSGPTKLLPFSQSYRPGYAAYRLPTFRDYFEDHYIQLPLQKGDAIFFNPALFHAAGENRTTDISRMANLLQISSAFGRAMETIDRRAMCKALYPVLRDATGDQSLAIAACAVGYSFPTNLDSDPPKGGLAPETQAALFQRALAEKMSPEDFSEALDALSARQAP